MAALPPGLIQLRDVILPLVGLMNVGPLAQRQTAQFLTLHGLTSVNDFNLIEPNQAKDLVRATVPDTLPKQWAFLSRTT